MPIDTNKQALLDTVLNYKHAMNYISSFMADNKLITSSANQVHKLVYNHIRDNFNLPSQQACSSIRNVVGSYRSLKSNKNLFIKGKINTPVYKKSYTDLVFNRDYSIKDNIVSIATKDGRVKCPFHTKGRNEYFDGSWTFGTAKLVSKNNNWYIYISATKEFIEPVVVNKVGIDLGINFIATSYNGTKTTFYSGKQIKNIRARYKRLRQQLQTVGTKSAKKKLKAINSLESRFINDINHCVSKALVKNNPNSLLILEDLSHIRPALAKVKTKDRYLMVSWPYADLTAKIEYKAIKYGCKVIRVDPKYTSQTCPHCGVVDKHSRNHKLHHFKCTSCGYQSNDDRVAAINLYHKG